MCLIAWRWQPDAPEPLVLLSNRDEFFDRPAKPLGRWHDVPIWAGQDVLAGGTWLGVGEAGRMAAITNYRTSEAANESAKSRGHMVRDFLLSQLNAPEFAEHAAREAASFNPFNLWLFDGANMVGVQGRYGYAQVIPLSPGYGSVSNADFNSPWPKQVQLQAQLQAHLKACLVSTDAQDDALLDLLRNKQTAPAAQLPQTGLSLDKELALSAICVRLPGYGTRASTLVRYGREAIGMTERSFDEQGNCNLSQVHVENFSNKLP